MNDSYHLSLESFDKKILKLPPVIYLVSQLIEEIRTILNLKISEKFHFESYFDGSDKQNF